jgi:SNF2 family DNA or RNA helicase
MLQFGRMERQAGLTWLAAHVPQIIANGIEVVQDGKVQSLTFEKPQIVLESKEMGDWFDIKAVVHIAGFVIPFLKFKRHILHGKRDFVLPNGAVAILPEAWFSDYRHLLEIAEQRDDETLSIRKYQAIILDMPLASTSNMKTKIGSLLEMSEMPEYPVPAGLRAEMRSYQKQGYNWLGFLQEYGFGGILADDMGLGKTLQTLTLLQREKEAGHKQPSLVVMPTSLIYNWSSESSRFTPNLKVLVHTGITRTVDVDVFTQYDVVFTTYGLVRQDVDMLAKFPFHYLILDESQMIKNPTSKTAKAVKELTAKHRLSLTGTPVENTLMDLWSQMTFLNPGLLGSEGFFRDFYIQPIEKYHDVDRTAKLKRLIHPFILRRTKAQVATELPEKVEQFRYCEMGDAQKKLYEETKNAYRNYLLGMEEGDFQRKKLNILAGLQKLRQIAIHPGLVEEGQGLPIGESGKFLEYEQLMEEAISKGSKVLVFSQFVRLLKILREDLVQKGIEHCYLDGATIDRQAQVERFQTDPQVQVFLISLKAGGVGLNLTAAEYVFILDPWWNPAVEAQAIDRSHRIGQVNTVFSYKFITKDTIEEKILKLQQRKFKLSQDVISVEKELFKKLDLSDLEELLV